MCSPQHKHRNYVRCWRWQLSLLGSSLHNVYVNQAIVSCILNPCDVIHQLYLDKAGGHDPPKPTPTLMDWRMLHGFPVAQQIRFQSPSLRPGPPSPDSKPSVPISAPPLDPGVHTTNTGLCCHLQKQGPLSTCSLHHIHPHSESQHMTTFFLKFSWA